MSIADVAKTVEELARAVSQRAKELDLLKAQYAEKLDTLNAYIAQLPAETKNSQPLDDEELLKRIESSRQCPHCRHSVDFTDTGMVLVPRSLIRVPQTVKKEEHTTKDHENGDLEAKLTQMTLQHTSSHESAKHPAKNRAAKKICSFCNKQGHSRARCWTRLNGQSPTSSQT